MEDLASLQSKSRKTLYIVVMLVSIGVVLFAVVPNLNLNFGSGGAGRAEIVASYSGTLLAGGNVTLTLEIRNTQASTITINKVVLIAYESDKISLSPEEFSVGQIAPRGYRRAKFNITAAPDALEGKYALEVKTEYPETTLTDTLELFVG